MSEAEPGVGARRPIPASEGVVGALGALLVAATIGYLVWLALGRDEGPPDVRVTAGAVHAVENGFVVEFRARNAGGTAAGGLLIEGLLLGPEGVVETAEATIDYLPPRSEREGGLIFRRDPRGHELRLGARGYVDP